MWKFLSIIPAIALVALMVASGAEAAGKNTINYPLKNVPSVAFSHSGHIKKLKNNCKACHNSVFNLGTHASATMVEMERGKSCGACHNKGKQAFTVAANCERCHKGLKPKDVVFALKGISAATFSHKIHTAAYGCNDCHTKLFPYKAVVGGATMADMEKGKSCGACHNGKDVFASSGDCEKCHKGFKPGNLTFKNSRGTIVGYFSHDFHTAAYKCQDCHTKIFPYSGGKRMTMTDMEQGKSCGACHLKDKDAFPVTGDCAKCHKKSW